MLKIKKLTPYARAFFYSFTSLPLPLLPSLNYFLHFLFNTVVMCGTSLHGLLGFFFLVISGCFEDDQSTLL